MMLLKSLVSDPRTRTVALAIGLLMPLAAALALFAYVNTTTFRQMAGQMVSEQATATLGTTVSVHELHVDGLRRVSLHGVSVHDKSGRILAQAESASIGFSLFSMATKRDPVAAISDVAVHTPTVNLVQAESGRWNYEDLVKEDGEPLAFAGVVSWRDGAANVALPQGTVNVNESKGAVDFAGKRDRNELRLEASGSVKGAEASVNGTVGDEIHLNVDGRNIEIADWLPWLPEGILPESVAIHGGTITRAVGTLDKASPLKVAGMAELSNGRLAVMGTEVSDLTGNVTSDGEVLSLDLSAKAAEQLAAVDGTVALDEDPRLALHVSADAFDVGKVLTDSPYHGAVAVDAKVGGSASEPSIWGDLTAESGEVYGYAFTEAKARAAYQQGKLYVPSLSGQVAGGRLSLVGELTPDTLDYNAQIALDGVHLEQVGTAEGALLPDVSGAVTANVGVIGQGADTDRLSAYALIGATGVGYQDWKAPTASASLLLKNGDVTVDTASATLPGDGEAGVSGTLTKDGHLDAAFYGTHLDLALLRNLSASADTSGLANVAGTLKGDRQNPHLAAQFQASDGTIMQQPFASLKGELRGSLDGAAVEEFQMADAEGKVHWLASGRVGFNGERRLNLRVDTMDVRAESLVAKFAPGTPLTGNVDNVITITGTMANPHIVGYVHLTRGSYDGYLLQGMDGDYTFNDGTLTVQDFHVFSPLVDAQLNGTLTRLSDLDMEVAAQDLDLTRFGRNLPYPISGHGKFTGHIGGTVSSPTFDGNLVADALVFNGENISDVAATVALRDTLLTFDPMSFHQDEGVFKIKGETDLATGRLFGRLDVERGNINALLGIANMKNEAIQGQVDGTLELAGTTSNPRATGSFVVPSGSIGGYPVTAVIIDGAYANRVVTLNRFEGKQGELGTFTAQGRVDLDGDLAATFKAQHIAFGMIPAAAGSDVPLAGDMNLDLSVGGTVNRPAADLTLNVVDGSLGYAAFDRLGGKISLKDWVIGIDNLAMTTTSSAKNTAGGTGKVYGLSVNGTAPMAALFDVPQTRNTTKRLALAITLDNADMGLLPELTQAVDTATGSLHGVINIGGKLSAPTFIGTLGVENGHVQMHDLATPIEELAVDVRLKGTAFTADASGKIGRGRFSVNGDSQLNGTRLTGYHLNVSADKLDIETSFLKAPISGEVRVTETANRRGELLPHLYARAAIDDATISLPSIPESSGEMPDVLLDVGLAVGNKTHFYSPHLYDIWLVGDVHYGGSTRHPQPSGHIGVRRGSVTYLQSEFKIREGEAYFNQVDSFLPSLNFAADTRLGRTKIFLKVTGPVETMRLDLSSSPEMSRSDILKYLTLRGAYQNGEQSGNQQWGALLGAGLQMSFLGDMEDSMRQFLNLDVFTVKQDNQERRGGDGDGGGGSKSEERYNLVLGKYIAEKVMLEYEHGLSGNSSAEVHRITARYDFDDRLSGFLGHRETAGFWTGFEGHWSF